MLLYDSPLLSSSESVLFPPEEEGDGDEPPPPSPLPDATFRFVFDLGFDAVRSDGSGSLSKSGSAVPNLFCGLRRVDLNLGDS